MSRLDKRPSKFDSSSSSSSSSTSSSSDTETEIKQKFNLKTKFSSEEDSKKIDKKKSRSRSSTPSSGHFESNKPKDPSPPVQTKINHFARPKSRQQNSSSSDESSLVDKLKNKILNEDNSRLSNYSDKKTNNNSRFKNNSDTDSDMTLISSKNSQKPSSDNFDRPKSSKIVIKKKKPILRSSSSSDSDLDSTSQAGTRSDLSTESSSRKKHNSDYEDDSSVPIKVNIERKPPIDKTSLNKKQSNKSNNFEKPSYNSDSDSDKLNSKQKYKKKLNETFQIDDDDDNDSQNSSNEITDVSPLQTPRNKNKSKKSTKNNEFLSANSTKFSRPNSVNFNDYNIQQTSSQYNRNNNDLNTCIDFTQTSYGAKLMRLDAENKRLYEKLLKAAELKPKKQTDKPVRLTSSALNRQREQQRIEKENQLILKRLLEVKSSKYLRKDDQLKDYERNFGYNSLNSSKLSSTSCLSSKQTSAKSSANNSRISSAKTITRSNFSLGNLDPNEILKRTASLTRNHRPEWNDRW